MENQENNNQQKPNNAKRPQQNKSRLWLYIVLFILLVAMVVYIVGLSNKIETKSYTEFQADVVAGKIVKIDSTGNTLRILLKDSKIKDKQFPSKADYKVTFINSELLITLINDYNNGEYSENGVAPETKIDITYNLAKQSWISSALPYMSFLLILVLGFILWKSMAGASGRNLGFGKTKAVMGENVKVRFSERLKCKNLSNF